MYALGVTLETCAEACGPLLDWSPVNLACYKDSLIWGHLARLSLNFLGFDLPGSDHCVEIEISVYCLPSWTMKKQGLFVITIIITEAVIIEALCMWLSQSISFNSHKEPLFAGCYLCLNRSQYSMLSNLPKILQKSWNWSSWINCLWNTDYRASKEAEVYF